MVQESAAIINNKRYWAAVESVEEAEYLCDILNSETLRPVVEQFQSQGQWGTRDIDKYVFNLPIPRVHSRDAIHCRLAQASKVVEEIANAVEVKRE